LSSNPLKVLYCIVQLVAVDMVYDTVRAWRRAEPRLGDQAMQ
jgi:hypothetical protein